jgi:hypothetical protein
MPSNERACTLRRANATQIIADSSAAEFGLLLLLPSLVELNAVGAKPTLMLNDVRMEDENKAQKMLRRHFRTFFKHTRNIAETRSEKENLVRDQKLHHDFDIIRHFV